jgi:acylphosphatase
MRVRVRYRGHVQGVGFRATAQILAREHTVTGWVRNESDGSVLLEAQGESRAVETLLNRVQQAMERHIDAAERVSAVDVAGENGFQIRR